ncbi:hypothetical protein [Glycomyces sp. NPDC048151]|uniref:hypothetical protein n=1 Tax=Glycomyces sp. NPDC048151 TaxID=3364002 RepID=UPI00371F1FFA
MRGRSYTIVFIEPVDLAVLATAVVEAFAIPRERIEVWDGDTFTNPAAAEPVIAQIATGSGPGAFAEFVGFEAFAEHTGAPETLEVAIALTSRMGRRAIFEPEAAEDYLWTVVAADGSHGHVALDSDKFDEGEICVLRAVFPFGAADDSTETASAAEHDRVDGPVMP